jgi:hypothetical protein
MNKIRNSEFFEPINIHYSIFNYFLIFSIFNPASAASLVCLSSKVRNRSVLIDKAEATWRMSNALEPMDDE